MRTESKLSEGAKRLIADDKPDASKLARFKELTGITRTAESKRFSEALSGRAADDGIASLRESVAVESFTEATSCAGQVLRVDREKCMVHGVKILGPDSKNGRSYSPAAISAARPIYENQAVFIDHNEKAAHRSYRDRNGRLVNVREHGGSLYADHHYNPEHPTTSQYLWDAENCPSNVGFSHDAEGTVSRKDGRTIVESITRVRSVDLVAKPATTSGLFE